MGNESEVDVGGCIDLTVEPVYGCTDEDACNYDSGANTDCDDCCDYPANDCTDCDGNDIGGWDCAGVCGGDSEEDCAGECNGDAVLDECLECNGDGSTCVHNVTLSITTSGEVLYHSAVDIGGFQFNIKDALIDKVSGGDAEESDFTTSFGKNVILGFSFEGKVIPAGCGILLTLETDQMPSGIDKIIISSIKGEELAFKYYK